MTGSARPLPFAPPRRLVVALALTLAACSGDGEVTEEAPLPAIPVEVEPLTEADMMGVPMTEVVLNLPWSGNPLSRDPAPAAARATVGAVELVEGERFDRAVFEFGADAPIPGYRVAWADSATTACGGEAVEPVGRVLVVRFEPATSRDEEGRSLVEPSRRPERPAMQSARQLCDEGDLLVWAFAVADSTPFRVIELRSPARLMVDLRHPGASTGQAPPAPAAEAAGG